MRLLPAVLLSWLSMCSVFGQSYTISTFAGGALPINIPGTAASLVPDSIAVDPAGNVFFVYQNTILRLDATTGILTLVAGNGEQGFSGDNGPATSAELYNPAGIAVDAAANVYISDNYSRIREVSNGVIATVAGGGTQLGDNGPATSALLNYPGAVAVDSVGNLYIAELGSNRVRKVSNGVITTVAGNGTQGFSGDNGPATSAQLSEPADVAVDSAGNLYIDDFFNIRIRKVSNGVITTVAGNGTKGFSGDNGPATAAQLSGTAGIAVDSSGNVYISDNNRIRKISNGVITTVAGGGTQLSDNAPATSAGLYPAGVAVDSAGHVYIADGTNRIRKVSNGVITTVAGNGIASFSGDNGPATRAQLNQVPAVAVDSAGNLYIADLNNRIRRVSNGVISTVAGGGPSLGDNGPATSGELYNPDGVALDSAGNLYIADNFNSRIRKVSNGVITTVAGNGVYGFSGDNGPATSAQVYNPFAVAVDSGGILYIADRSNHRIRKVSNGVITTVAGNGTPGFSGDNGPATSAQLNGPQGITVDSDGNLYIADTDNSRIRKVSNGVITTVAGNGPPGFSGDNGPATGAQLKNPGCIAVDSAANLYIADTGNSRIRKVSNGVISTVAGNGAFGFSGDNGPATSARLNSPGGIAVGSGGILYIADTDNYRVRLLTPSGLATAPLSISGVNNAASNLPGPIAPGEIVVVYGSGLGPSQLTLAHLGADGLYDGALASTSVQFDGIRAPLIYTSTSQVATIVPYEVTGASAQVTVTYQGQTSASVTVAVAASAPGLFTLGSTGQGQAAAVNQNGAINTSSTPAAIGSIISLFATGEGQTSPTGSDGKPATAPLPTPNLPVSVTIGGVTVNDLQYVGGATGEVAGLMQINVQIPSGIQTGPAVPVVVQVGSASSQAGVTISVGEN